LISSFGFDFIDLKNCLIDDLYADWHNSKVGTLFYLGADVVLSVGIFY